MRSLTGAFYNCKNLLSISFPDGITIIEDYIFYQGHALKTVYIPASVTTIADSAFIFCSALTDVYYGGSEEQWSAVEIAANNEEITAGVRMHYNSTEIHDYTVTAIEAVPATCVPGHTEGTGCSVCHTPFSGCEEIPASSDALHTMSEENGFVCAYCGEATYTEVASAEELANCLTSNEYGTEQVKAMIYIENVGYFNCSDVSTLGSVVKVEGGKVPANILSSNIISFEELYGTSGQNIYCPRLMYTGLDSWAYLGVVDGDFTDDGVEDVINWQVIDAEGGIYLKNLGTEEYLCATADGFGLKSTPDESCVIKLLVLNIE